MLAKVLHLALWRAARPPAPRPAPPLVAIREALARVERLVPSRSAPEIVEGPVLRRLTLAEVVVSPWDPEPVVIVPPPPPPRVIPPMQDDERMMQEINGCKTLLLEIIRRASYDWVLYRGSRRMVQKVLAEQAFRWLFTEMPGTPEWQERHREGKHITSFEAICESLDLDPDTVRKHIKRLTPKNVMSVGRPAEYRRRDVFSANSGDEDAYQTPGILVEYNDGADEDPSY